MMENRKNIVVRDYIPILIFNVLLIIGFLLGKNNTDNISRIFNNSEIYYGFLFLVLVGDTIFYLRQQKGRLNEKLMLLNLILFVLIILMVYSK